MDNAKPELLRLDNVAVTVQTGKLAGTLSHSLSFALPSGGILAIAGKSGIGKSTLLRSLVRLHPLCAGSAYFKGRNIIEWTPTLLRRSMIYLPQRPAFGSQQVLDLLLEPFGFNAVGTPAPSREEIVSHLPEAGIKADLLDQPAHLISGGEGQRIALLRALLLEPDVLLLDEPTANLDPVSAGTIVGRVKKWVAEGHGAVWVVHDRAVIAALDAPVLYMSEDGFHTEEVG